MGDVVDITEKIKENVNLKAEKKYFDNHNAVLDYAEELFYKAIIIEICKDGSINLSSSHINPEETIDALVSAAFKVKENMDKSND